MLLRWPLPLRLQKSNLPFRLLYLWDRLKTNFIKACIWPKCCTDWGEWKNDVLNGRNRAHFCFNSAAFTSFYTGTIGRVPICLIRPHMRDLRRHLTHFEWFDLLILIHYESEQPGFRWKLLTLRGAGYPNQLGNASCWGFLFF